MSTARQVGDHAGEFGELRGGEVGEDFVRTGGDGLGHALHEWLVGDRQFRVAAPVQEDALTVTVPANSRSIRLLPMPASPDTSTCADRPAQAVAQAAASACSSAPRPARDRSPMSRAAGRWRRSVAGDSPGFQPRILGQHHLLQPPQCRAGIDPQLGAQCGPKVLVGLQASAWRPHR